MWKYKKGGKRCNRDRERSDAAEEKIDGIEECFICTVSVRGTREAKDICFTLERALGLLHAETQPGVSQHSKILPLVSPPPPPLANQELGGDVRPTPLSTLLQLSLLWSLTIAFMQNFKWGSSSEHFYITMLCKFCHFYFLLLFFSLTKNLAQLNLWSIFTV